MAVSTRTRSLVGCSSSEPPLPSSSCAILYNHVTSSSEISSSLSFSPNYDITCIQEFVKTAQVELMVTGKNFG